MALGTRCPNGRLELRRLPDDPHSFPSAPCCCFNQDGKADFRRQVHNFFITEILIGPGNRGHPDLLGEAPGRGLGTAQPQRLGGGADECNPRRLTGFGKGGILSQEAIAGVNGLGPAVTGHIKDPVDPEIALGRGRGTDVMGLIRLSHVES